MDFLRGAAKAVWGAVGAGVTTYAVQIATLTEDLVAAAAPAAATALVTFVVTYLKRNFGPKANVTG